MTGPDSPLIHSLRKAVESAPDDVPLRLHLAGLLLQTGDTDGAVEQAAAALQREPGWAEARNLMARAVGADAATEEPPDQAPPREEGHPDQAHPTQPSPDAATSPEASASEPAPNEKPAAPGRSDRDQTSPADAESEGSDPGFDWERAEHQLRDVAPPMFVPSESEPSAESSAARESAFDVESSTVRLDDVGGMAEVKARLEAAFLAPMRNPELRKTYGKSLRGGLLLYGPPGCGKTFIARAVAGELGTRFLAVSLADVLDMWLGSSEKNVKAIFDTARRHRPCVVFLDELDAIGLKRLQLGSSALRGSVNQLLTELDSMEADNEGVFVLAATNQPWDVDGALLRPGRLDRMLLVVPPDAQAREAILRYHLRDRPVGGIDLGKLARGTDGFSGADLAHLCDTAAERAMLDAARTGTVRLIEMGDFTAAQREVRPSTGSWFETARNVALFANAGGRYDELLAYLKRRKMV